MWCVCVRGGERHQFEYGGGHVAVGDRSSGLVAVGSLKLQHTWVKRGGGGRGCEGERG